MINILSSDRLIKFLLLGCCFLLSVPLSPDALTATAEKTNAPNPPKLKTWEDSPPQKNSPPQAMPDAPEQCAIGAYLTALHGFAYAEKTFQADFWLWSHCASEDNKPLTTMEFVNANKTQVAVDIPEVKKQDFLWAQRKITGTFRYAWGLHAFPFDRHTLIIALEESAADTSAFRYLMDAKNSGYNELMVLPGWKISGFRLVEHPGTYHSNFGDPELAPGSGSEYTGMQIQIDLQRTEKNSFFKLVSSLYVVFLLAMLSYFVAVEMPPMVNLRLNILVGAVFATVINMLSVSSVLGSEEGITLLDELHILTLIYILLAAGNTIVSRLLFERGLLLHQTKRFDYVACVVTSLLYGLANAWRITPHL